MCRRRRRRAESACVIAPHEARLLAAPEAPIVLLEKRVRMRRDAVAPNVAPGSRTLGVMLPYTPLHHLLLRDVGGPLVGTSGNLSDEPMVHRRSARRRAARRHRRPVPGPRPADRAARGRLDCARDAAAANWCCAAPAATRRCRSLWRWHAPPTLAVGAHLKNTVAMTAGLATSFISQHIGDLEHQRVAANAFREAVDSLERLYRVDTRQRWRLTCIPDYALDALRPAALGLPVRAGAAPLRARRARAWPRTSLSGRVLGVAWDGTGYGPDGTIWGGEFLRDRPARFARVACLRPFRLPGGERAVREPRRAALGLLFAMSGDGRPPRRERPARAFTRRRAARCWCRRCGRGSTRRSRPARAGCSTRSAASWACDRSARSKGRRRWRWSSPSTRPSAAAIRSRWTTIRSGSRSGRLAGAVAAWSTGSRRCGRCCATSEPAWPSA